MEEEWTVTDTLGGGRKKLQSGFKKSQKNEKIKKKENVGVGEWEEGCQMPSSVSDQSVSLVSTQLKFMIYWTDR